MRKRILFTAFFLWTLFTCCSREKSGLEDISSGKTGINEGTKYKIVIVMDTVDDWSSGIRDGFKETMNSILEKYGSDADYYVYDTKLNESEAANIVEDIKVQKPDIICMINYPTVFADRFVSLKLSGPEYRIVSENCIPVLSGTVKSWDSPGGNITGVGVFIQMNSPIRLMKKIDPKRNKLVFYTWDAVKTLNGWFKKEISRAAADEGIELLEFREVKHYEETVDLFEKYDGRRDVFFIGGVSAYVHEDGSPVSEGTEIIYFRDKISVPCVSYDETVIHDGLFAGTCVIWFDIGAQLAEKAEMLLNGQNPGDIPWSYPRKYNIVLNSKRAGKLGINFPQEIISAAYRIYTDYDGNFIGQDK